MSDHSDDERTVAAVGKLSTALEAVERARGHLYSFHQLTGTADLTLDAVVDELAAAGHQELADYVQTQLIGRNVLPGRWTYEVVEEYERTYYDGFVEVEQTVREKLLDGRRHVHEAAMKERRRTRGHPAHTPSPSAAEASTH